MAKHKRPSLKLNSPASLVGLVVIVGGLVVALILVSSPSILFPRAAVNRVLSGPLPVMTSGAAFQYSDILSGKVANRVTNNSTGQVTFSWACRLSVSNRACTDHSGKAIGMEANNPDRTVTLSPGQSFTLPLSADWGPQSPTGMYEMHYNVWVSSPRPPTPGAYDMAWDIYSPINSPTIARCVVGYLSTRETLSTGSPNAGYVSAARTQSALSQVSVPTEFRLYNLWSRTPVATNIATPTFNDTTDLWATTSSRITENNFNDVNVLIISDGPTPAEKRNSDVPNRDRLTLGELKRILDNHNRNMDIVLAGDNGYWGVGIDEASVSVRPVVNNSQNILRYLKLTVTSVNQVSTTTGLPAWGTGMSFLNNQTINTQDVYRSPGDLHLVNQAIRGNTSCMYQVVNARTGRNICLLSYSPHVPGGRGYLYVDANAGIPTNTAGALGKLINHGCTNN